MQSYSDILTSTYSCDNLEAYLKNKKFDMEGLEEMLKQQFGADEIESTKKELDLYFNKYPTDIMEYLELL